MNNLERLVNWCFDTWTGRCVACAAGVLLLAGLPLFDHFWNLHFNPGY